MLNDLADRIAATIDGIHGLPEQVKEESDTFYHFFNIFLPKIIDKYLSGKKLVLLLDEFDVLTKDEKTKNRNGKKIFDGLEKAVKEQEKLFAILVFGRSLKDMDYLEAFLQKEGQKPIEVGLLDYESTENLIVQPAKGILEYEKSAIENIWKLSAGHPYLTQLLCSNIFVYCKENKKKKVCKDDVKSILSKAMEQGEPVLQDFLQPLNEEEKSFFCQVAKGEKIEKYLAPKGKSLVELSFLEEDGDYYKIKVEFVQLWLAKCCHLSDNKKLQEEKSSKINQNPTETNNKHKMPTRNRDNNSQGPNPIAKARSFIVLLLILFSLVGYSFVRIQNSLESKASKSECFRLLEDIDLALRQPKERSRVIEETRNRRSRKEQKEQSLYAQCPYTETEKLEKKYNKLLHLYGSNLIDISEYEKAIIPLCEITDKYEELSKIKDIFVKWISTDGVWDRKKIIEKLIEQNESEHGCLIYSFKSQRNKDKLYEQRNQQYYQEAKKYINNFKFEKAVASYCKISKEYDGFDNIVKELKGWLSDESKLYDDEIQKVEEKLQELNNQCPVSPLNNITN
jgi:hypothetical protein